MASSPLQPNAEIPLYLRVSQICGPILPICRSTFYELIKRQVIKPGRRLGGAVVYSRDDILALVNGEVG